MLSVLWDFGFERKESVMDRVRVIRVLEYEGPRDWVESTLANNTVKGTKTFQKGGDIYYIREAIVGDFPAIVEEVKEERVPYKPTELQAKFMMRFGWEFPEEGFATKHEAITGKVFAHEGDETWTRDLKVAGE